MNKPAGYSRTQIVLHWTIALLILFQFLFHDSMEEAWRAVMRGQAEPGGFHPHAVVGILVFVLTIWRLLLRGRRGAPDLPEGGNPLQDMLAVWTHRVLYALLFLIPVSGFVAWNFGVEVLGGVHGAMFFLAMMFVGLHTIAAVYHQYVLKDELIARMLKAR